MDPWVFASLVGFGAILFIVAGWCLSSWLYRKGGFYES
jgi:hypothetical protein